MSSVEAALLVQDEGRLEKLLPGGWEPIKNINDSYVQEIGRFAVMEHDKTTGDCVNFIRVVRGETQVVAGTNYKLVIQATRNGEKMFRFYEGVVWVKPWEKTWTLISFMPLPPV